jgi:hypothetical protein
MTQRIFACDEAVSLSAKNGHVVPLSVPLMVFVYVYIKYFIFGALCPSKSGLLNEHIVNIS